MKKACYKIIGDIGG